jgi:hypothetical protein
MCADVLSKGPCSSVLGVTSVKRVSHLSSFDHTVRVVSNSCDRVKVSVLHARWR